MRNYFPDPSGFTDYMRTLPAYDETVKKFADQLHSQACRLSHMDQCEWEYEADDWTKFVHERYFRKAKELLSSGVPSDAILEILSVLRNW